MVTWRIAAKLKMAGYLKLETGLPPGGQQQNEIWRAI
jgi:hypothetical protein